MKKPHYEGQLLLLAFFIAALCLYAGYSFARLRSAQLPDKDDITWNGEVPFGPSLTPEQKSTLIRLVKEERTAIENDIRSDNRMISAGLKVHSRIEWDRNGGGTGHILIAGKCAIWQKRVLEEIENKYWAKFQKEPYQGWILLDEAIGVLYWDGWENPSVFYNSTNSPDIIVRVKYPDPKEFRVSKGELLKVLKALPKISWPYGRVMSVHGPGGHPGFPKALPAFNNLMKAQENEIKEAGKALKTEIYWRPV